MKRKNWEDDDATFSADAYSVRQYPGIAFRVYGWETVPDEDTGVDGHRKPHGPRDCRDGWR